MNPKRFALLLMLGASLASAQTTTPNLLSYQGRVTDASGVLIGNSVPVNRTVTFRFYSASTGGTAVYTETQTVTISGGEFSVLLGNGTGVSGVPGPSSPASQPYKTLADLFNSTTTGTPNLYLGVTVDDGTAAVDLEISPRQQFVSGAYAFHAKVAESVLNGAVNTNMLGDAQVTTLKIASSAVDSSRILDATIVAADIAPSAITSAKIDTSTVGLWTPIGSNVWRNGNVGIGESNPAYPLNFGTASFGAKISLWSTGANHYGFGIQGGLLQIYSDSTSTDVAIGSGSSAVFTETMRVKGSGSVGIGITTPLDRLHVNGGNIRITTVTNPVLSIFGGTAEADLAVVTNAGAFSSYAVTNDTVLRSISGKLLLQSGTGAAGISIDSGNNVSIYGNLDSNTTHSRGNMTTHGQGAYLEWNRSGGTGESWLLNQRGGGSGGICFGEVDTSNGVTERMRIASNGYVGIGNSSPSYPLHVSSTVNVSYLQGSSVTTSESNSSPQIGNPDNYTANGINRFSNPTWPTSIWADGVIAGTAFYAMSDLRIKDIVARSASRSDLALVNQLQVTDYRLKDRIGSGVALHKGLIAQEVRGVIPEAVSASRNYLPDIYAPATQSLYDAAQKRLSLTLAKPHALAVGDWVRIHGDASTMETQVLTVLSSTSFVVASEKPVARAFVYGRRVEDFLTVDYDRVFTTGIGAIQELSKKLEEKDAKISELEARLSALEKLLSVGK